MNRLILIDNGFDLGHGLKTGYNDFLKWYLHQALVTAGKAFKYEDGLLKVEKPNLEDEIYFDQKIRTEMELRCIYSKRETRKFFVLD
ncbi:AbiH family protein [Mucilaginibacter sp.]